ncbi:hypothetical protein Y032_0005g2302 [Ancylostoma ceylanicum]|uniref:Uncharacterized protein n=1 Tax=Ancylostoma ceylanicum TaxID=53326 RepID=A0A016VR12_9BILA|nr:hypothetical protein Y032_0005g2302 [Ancylostoma ceylanicum]
MYVHGLPFVILGCYTSFRCFEIFDKKVSLKIKKRQNSVNYEAKKGVRYYWWRSLTLTNRFSHGRHSCDLTTEGQLEKDL